MIVAARVGIWSFLLHIYNLNLQKYSEACGFLAGEVNPGSMQVIMQSRLQKELMALPLLPLSQVLRLSSYIFLDFAICFQSRILQTKPNHI